MGKFYEWVKKGSDIFRKGIEKLQFNSVIYKAKTWTKSTGY